MTQTHYDTIIIGTGHSDLIHIYSSLGDLKIKPPFSQRLVVTDYAGTAMYSA
jgi:hypothetical protein